MAGIPASGVSIGRTRVKISMRPCCAFRKRVRLSRAHEFRSLPAQQQFVFPKRVLRRQQFAHSLLMRPNSSWDSTRQANVTRLALNLLFDPSYANLEKLIRLS